tara:strand:- start:725 stop:949 length:225 start_codon:yes stop_codon:yes gene_type:complete
MNTQEKAFYDKQAKLAAGATRLAKYGARYCPWLKGSSIMKTHELVDMINRFEGDLDECQLALDKVNAILEGSKG